MLKKARAARDAEVGGTETKDLSKSVLESSRQIWLAGLGAFSRAQAEGMKVFDSLVRQGEAVETRTRRAATDTATAARHAAQAKAREMQQMAGGTWDKLEKVFEDRVARALSRLGVHTQSDVDRLAARVDALSDAVNQLIKTHAGKAVRRSDSSSGRRAKGAASTSPRSTAPAGRHASDAEQGAAQDTAGEAYATTGTSAERRARRARKAVRGASK